MKKILYVASVLCVVLLTACGGGGGGDVNIEPTTIDNSTDNSTTNPPPTDTEENPCAAYSNSGGQTIAGVFDGLDCTYAPTFVDAGNNLTVDMTIPALSDGGAHIFQGSLFVGDSFDTDADLASAGIVEGGDGPVLTIEADATLAFTSNSDFMIINRGSQVFAVGTEMAPIVITSVSDVESSRLAAPSLAGV